MAPHSTDCSSPSGKARHLGFFWITLAAVALFAGWLAHHDAQHVYMPSFHAAAPAIPPEMQAAFTARGAGLQKPGRTVYPYSVVPGGVATVQELKTAIATDPVVAAHYAGLNLARTRVTRSDSERLVYVSYRRGDQLFWTKNKLKVAKGETLITDGVITARTRCGNQVSDKPSAQTSTNEPAAEELDKPAPADDSSTRAYNANPLNDWGSDLTTISQGYPSGSDGQTSTGGPGNSFPGKGASDQSSLGPGPKDYPLYLPPAGRHSNTTDSQPVADSEPVAVPEPSTLALLLTAFPAIWAFRKRKL